MRTGRPPKDHTPMMEEIFGMFEYHIFEKLQSVDNMLSIISKDARTAGIPNDYREEFVRAKIIDMIDQIAEERERTSSDKNKGGSKHERLHHSRAI